MQPTIDACAPPAAESSRSPRRDERADDVALRREMADYPDAGPATALRGPPGPWGWAAPGIEAAGNHDASSVASWRGLCRRRDGSPPQPQPARPQQPRTIRCRTRCD